MIVYVHCDSTIVLEINFWLIEIRFILKIVQYFSFIQIYLFILIFPFSFLRPRTFN